MRINLGDKVRDKLTGLEGVVIARTEWLFGCVRVTIQPAELKDGKPVESTCIDEPQGEIIAAQEDRSPVPYKHGTRPDPGRSADPTR